MSRKGPHRGVTKTHLAFVVSAPAVDGTHFGERNTVVLSSIDLDYVISIIWVKLLNPGRCRWIEFISDTQLPMIIQSPWKYLVFVIDVEWVIIPAKNVLCLFCANFFNCHCVFLFFTSLEVSANLSAFWITTSIDFSAFWHNNGVMCATCDLFDSDFGLITEKLSSKSFWLQNLWRRLTSSSILYNSNIFINSKIVQNWTSLK